MFRPAFRAATVARAVPKIPSGRRFASTAASRSGSWRGAALRWGLAGAGVYYYNTATAFAEEPQFAIHSPPEVRHESETYATVDAIAEQRRAQARGQTSAASVAIAEDETSSPSTLEEEAEQQGAFNEETGEINWDCPCLGGMANGPCGEQFRAAFSCFVYSKEEPKGVDCIEHFKTMQNCFREHPDVYGEELEDDELAPPEEHEGQPAAAPVSARVQSNSPEHASASQSSTDKDVTTSQSSNQHERGNAAKVQVKQDFEGPGKERPEADDVVPKAWHDTREGNTAK